MTGENDSSGPYSIRLNGSAPVRSSIEDLPTRRIGLPN